jgi:hypothetical protein
MRDLRKHTSWYLHGFEVGGTVRRALRQVATLDELDVLLAQLDGEQPLPASSRRAPRGHTHGPKPVKLPEGWLDRRSGGEGLAAAAASVVSGG